MKKKKSTQTIMAILLCCILIFISIGYLHYKKSMSVKKDITSFIPEFETAQTQDIKNASISKGIQIPGYSVIPIKADTSSIAVDLQNPAENEVYFQISFYLADTQEMIYQSKLIEPGQHLYQISLLHGLEVGEYPLTIQYDTFSMDGTYTPKNGATVNCILSVS